jgi:hypothetical protein
MSQQATQWQSSSVRARELRDALLALRREQGLLVAELVWNEMRAREDRERLAALPAGATERAALERDLRRRLELIRSLARWERDADRSYGRHWEALATLAGGDAGLAAALPQLEQALAEPRLASIARAAAHDLGLALDGGVDGC